MREILGLLRAHWVNLAYLTLLISSLSCGVNAGAGSPDSSSGPSNTERAQPTPQAGEEVAGAPVAQKSFAIRDVDFRNFTFHWYPSDYPPPPSPGKREITLRNGAMKVDSEKNTDRIWFRLANVSYADLTADGREEAIVTVVANFDPNGSVACTFIYTENKEIKLLWSRETGDRANGGLRSIRVVDGSSFVLEQYEIKFDKRGNYESGASLCCPKRFVRATYVWKNGAFEEVASETLANEYATAEFLGYPSDHSAQKNQ